jgi:glutathione S-transferase
MIVYRVGQYACVVEESTMKLYYSPFACSLAAHIAWREAGLDVTMVRVELGTTQVEDGGDLRDVSKMGQVPVLVRDDGQVLTENTAILTYIADCAPQRRLGAGATSPLRYEQLRWLSFISTEVHKKVLNAVFSADSPEAVREHGRAGADRPLAVLASELEQRDTLVSSDFTVCDAYLVWALQLIPHAGLSLERYPALRRYQERHTARPAVVAAMNFEREQRRR